ncbi:MAG TPA: formylglycine-generating enzyme family protein [Candidatus Paceibacterota bacterium]|nr:formylglycine-generating enzyme family protein [Candidatus Paceibacterota bacterium]
MATVLAVGKLPTSAQNPADLDLQLYAGLTITGTIDTIYSVECVTDFAQTNNASAWSCVEFLKLPASSFLWVDKSAPAKDKRFYRAVAFAAPNQMVFIPPGTFWMGSPTTEAGRSTNEGPQTAVTISRGFWMGKYPVTQEEYRKVVGSNPSRFIGNSSRPVEQVDWFSATNYCAMLTRHERALGLIPMGSAYRLPTEAEWEYACRAWTSTRFSYGDDPGYTNLTRYAWYGDNSGGTTHPVGMKQPNPWGLYDMHGNVFEWTQSWYGPYSGGSQMDPKGPASGTSRVYRGGAWYEVAGLCRSALRGKAFGPTTKLATLGFRVVLAPEESQQ